MKRDLKTFITENRDAFDDANPPQSIWDGIAHGLDRQEHVVSIKRAGIARVLKVAAVAFLVCTTGVLIYFFGKKQAYDDYSKISPGLAAEQQTYVQLVSQKKDSIAYIAAANPTLYGEFSEVLQQMEANYDTLKIELDESPNKELTLEAMIRNLRVQIEVLSQQLEVLNYINETKTQPKNEQI